MTELKQEHFEVIDRNKEVNHLNKIVAQPKSENNTLNLYNQEYKNRIQELEKRVVELKQKIQIKELYESQEP